MDRQSLVNEKFEQKQQPVSFQSEHRIHYGLLPRAGAVSTDECEDYLLLIDARALDRECLSRSLTEYDESMNIVTVGSFEEWQKRRMQSEPSAILFMIGGRKVSDADVSDKISALAERFKASPVIVGAESDELAQLLKALECGARRLHSDKCRDQCRRGGRSSGTCRRCIRAGKQHSGGQGGHRLRNQRNPLRRQSVYAA